MTSGLSLNLQLMQDLTSTLNSKSNQTQNSKPDVYAKEGESRYIEEMDYDGDGVVTMDEYQKYLEENSVSTTQQAQNIQSMGDSMVNRQVAEQAEQTETQEKKFDYNEYMQYCEANAVSQPSTYAAIKPENIETNEAGLIIHNFGKALNSYSKSNLNYATSKFEMNA